ncbi:MAG: hypothetical protein C0483_01160 [Pirellula sp.]|nr:hypothetical protein [Pirellula sp.]
MIVATKVYPTSEVQPTSGSTRLYYWFFALTIAALALHVLIARHCTNPDPFTYAQIGKQLLAGKTLYVDALTDKPLLAPLLFMPPQLLVPNRYWPMAVYLGLVVALQCVILLRAVRPSFWSGLTAVIFLSFVPFAFWDWHYLSTEHLSNVFILSVLVCCRRVSEEGRCDRRLSVLLGVLLGLAYLTRPTTAVTALVPLCVLCSIPGGWIARFSALIGVFVGGATTVAASVAAVALWTGRAENYLNVLFVYPRVYVSASSETATFLYYLEAGEICQLLPLATGLAFLAAFTRHRVLIWSALIAAVLNVVASPRPYQHYIVNTFPALALAMVCCFDGPLQLTVDRTSRQNSRGAGLAMLFLALFLPAVAARVYVVTRTAITVPNVQVLEGISNVIDERYPSAKTMWVVAPMGHEYLLFASRLKPAHPVRSAWELDLPRPEILYKEASVIQEEYLASPPDLIVLQSLYEVYLDPLEVPVEKSLTCEILRALLKTGQYRLEKRPLPSTDELAIDPMIRPFEPREYRVFVRKPDSVKL